MGGLGWQGVGDEVVKSGSSHSTPATPKPPVIITPLHVSQIQATIKCSQKHGMQIRVRSGGHDFEGLSYVSYVPYVIIDLINLRSINVDVENGTAWVKTGATLGEVYYTIAEKSRNFGFPAGLCPTVGVGGHFSGGGYGTLLRKYGLAVDNIVDAQMIDVKGRILDKESMGEDLFWAIRGGGEASLGVIVAWKIKLVHVPSIVTVFTVNRNLEQNATKLVNRAGFIISVLYDSYNPCRSNSSFVHKSHFKSSFLKVILKTFVHHLKMSEILEYAIPFPHRVEGIDASESHISWIRRLYSYMAAWVSKYPRAAYINYRDLDIGTNSKEGNTSYRRATTWGTKYFKSNFNRLVHVKTMVDLSNFFRNEQSIPALSS
ncbi:hypothetical protein I3843_09G142000 [Carya illinoinensis]|nr:hypothetical protein I3843_09G142000 [Carya illinoinensis]